MKDAPSSLSDIRERIDDIDSTIVMLLADRWTLAMSAVKFKVSEDTFRDHQRRAEVIKARMDWAKEKKLPPILVEKLFHQLIDYVEFSQELLRSGDKD